MARNPGFTPSSSTTNEPIKFSVSSMWKKTNQSFLALFSPETVKNVWKANISVEDIYVNVYSETAFTVTFNFILPIWNFHIQTDFT